LKKKQKIPQNKENTKKYDYFVYVEKN